MARLSRVVIPGVAHHVTQRGNRREPTFFEDGDYQLYLDLLADAASAARVEVWMLGGCCNCHRYELGHAVMGDRDDGPDNMSNVNKNENPIRRELKMP